MSRCADVGATFAKFAGNQADLRGTFLRTLCAHGSETRWCCTGMLKQLELTSAAQRDVVDCARVLVWLLHRGADLRLSAANGVAAVWDDWRL
jgi:hypothetical protein